MRWNLISHLAMWGLMAFMSWDMWVAPHPTVTIGMCGGD